MSPDDAVAKSGSAAEAADASQHILVCVGPSPASARLIYAAHRMADALRAPWTAAYVDRIGATPLRDDDRERLEEHLRLAESLGATAIRLRGSNIAKALLAYARQHGVSRLIAGKPTHSRWRDRLRGSLHDALIRESGPVDVLVIAPDDAPPRPRLPAVHERRIAPYLTAVAATGVVTGLGLVASDYLDLADIAMLYLIAIVVSSLTGRGPALLAATLAVLGFNFSFIPPRFTLQVAEARHLITFAVMFGAGLTISTLMVRLRAQEADAWQRERHTAALLAFTRDVRDAGEVSDVAVALVRHIEEVIDVAVAVLLPEGTSRTLVPAAGLMPLAEHEIGVARWSYEHGERAGQDTGTMSDARILAVPLVVGASTVGVVVVQTRPGSRRLDADQRHLLDAFVLHAALAIGRAALMAEAQDAELRARAEELRSSLLSVVSHDLRTPLAVITGAATSLRDDAQRLTNAGRTELLDTLIAEASRLERVVANLLGMTRVETGIEPAREWIPVEELVGVALGRVEHLLGDRLVTTDIPADLAVHVDPVLFSQVLINLVENAVKHGRPPIEIVARRDGEKIEIDVADHGGGLPDGAEERIFEKFYRASPAPGVGLGLAVVRGIVVAHGGSVMAVPRATGARFRISLPAPAAPSVNEPSVLARHAT